MQPKTLVLLVSLVVLSLGSVVISLFFGSSAMPFSTVLHVLLGDGTPMQQTLVWELRLPRALLAFVTGALLALAGLLMQVLLRNPLADPYVLGVSGGASFSALLALLAGWETSMVTGSAFVGALSAIFIVFLLAQGKGGWTITRLLLTGVVMAAGWGAAISFVLVVSPPEKMSGMLFWLMGDLSYDRPLLPGAMILLFGFLACLPLSRQFNVMIWGERQAAGLGVDVNRLRLQIFFLASLMTAGAVSSAGGIGFVGLVVPHFMRLLVGNDHRILVPASALAGAILLLWADLLARTAVSPQQLPVGVVTALLGVPMFLFLLRRNT